ncbi:hypothetical protein TNCV_1497241 [Trichonephila clavipes]|nr:hypothetical protein TNCV_1497241 [Trichonephila clavipes]
MSIIVLGALWLKCVGVSGAIISIAEATAQLLRILPLALLPPWVPTRVFSVKISKEKGSIIMCENSIEFRNINGAVWMSIDTRHSDFGVVT